jgi:hypothetical protein
MKATVRLLAVIAFVLATSVAYAANPSVLVCSPQGISMGWLDLDYAKELVRAGIEVDCTDRLADVTWDRVKQYNVLILYMTPATIPGQPDLKSEADFVRTVTRFVEAGGGVFLWAPENNMGRQVLQPFTDVWGAKLPAENIIENDKARQGILTQDCQQNPLAWTDTILPSPVSEGVKGIWYPIRPAYNGGMSGPLLVDSNWTVVVNGSPTSVTKPVDMSKSPSAIANPFVRPGGVPAPPLFAIRSVGAGRVALVNQWQQFSIGSGTKFIFNREVLDRGVNGKPSDFGRLLQNTCRWLAEPSLKSAVLGGYTTLADRLDPPNARESVKKDYRETKVEYDPAKLGTVEIPAQRKLYRGLIGAKSAYSSGIGTVAEFAAAARQAGLDFLIFMEDFDQLTPAKFEQLKADCKTHSDDKVLLLAGFNIVNNIGNHMFFYGPDPVWPSDLVLTGQKKNILYIAEEDGKGGFTGDMTPYLDWVLGAYHVAKGQVGYYNFSDSPHGMRMPDLRLYAMAATRYYRNGKLVEDMTDQYLTTAQCTIPPTPASVNEVTSPQQLIAEAGSGHALMYAQAESLGRSAPTGVFMGALRWNHQYDGLPVFNSDGPKILAWPNCFRVWTYGGEEFVTSKNVMLSPLLVTSDKGLKSISLYNGRALFRRFLCRGAKQFSQMLVLDGTIQRDIVLIAEDVTGGRAVTFARRCWKDGALASSFCSDHVNDGLMRLAHGPYWYPFTTTPALSPNIAGDTWDGGPPAVMPYIRYQGTTPTLDSVQGRQDANRLDQWPALEFSDEGAMAVQTQRNEQYDDRVARVINPWRTYGPINGPAKLFTITQRYREWVTPTIGVWNTNWAGIGVRVGVSSSILNNTLRFQTTVKPNTLLAGFMAVKGDTTLAVGTPEGVKSVEIGSGHPTIPLKHGAWFGFVGKGLGNAQLFFNRGPDMTLVLTAQLELRGNLEGVEFKQGDTYTTEIAGFGFPLDVPVHTPEGLQKYVDYLAQPAGMQILRGTRADSAGVLELTPTDSAVELSIPCPAEKLSLTVPLLVRGLNTRWSVGLFQKAGYSKGFYGPGTNRYRPVGLDFDGNAYIPLYVDWADLTHVMVGHPIVADEDGNDLFIQVTKVADNPDRWHVSVNNPTDEKVTTTLRKAMDLPGLVFTEMKITLQPGEYRVIL